VTLPTIARHFHLGGDRARAFEYGIRAARASIASFGHEEAKSMASLALSQAVTNGETYESLDIVGRSAFALGQLDEAEDSVSQILSLDRGVSANDRVQAHLMQGRILLESSDWEGSKHVLQAADLASLESPSAQVEATLCSLSLQLKGAMRQLDGQLARQISTEIRRTHALGADRQILTDVAAVRSYYSLAAYAAFFESVTEADELVGKAWRHCSDVPDELSVRVLLMRGVVKSHRALWDQAIVLFQQALALAKEKNQVLETGIAWNNLAYCALEQAKWAEAEEYCRASMGTYSKLPPGTYVTATPLTNLGDAFFFQGFARKAIPVYEEALRETRPDLRPQMLASLGLATLQLGDAAAAAKHWDSLCDLDDWELRGVQERFKIAWLRAYMTALSKPNEAGELLLEAANAQRDLNAGSHLKLLWLGKLLSNGSHARDTEATETIIKRLKDARLGWFVRFSSRWLSLAQATTQLH
jgi:tetratricopeptide (TPR) repeat protein